MSSPDVEAVLADLFASNPAFASRAGFVDRSDRALLRVRGSDRVRFLNAMLTNDVDCEAGSVCPIALLDRKGHVLSEGTAFVGPDDVVLESTPDGPMREVLEKHIIADDVELEALAPGQVSIEGPGTADALRRAGLEVPAAARFEMADGLLCAGGGWLSSESGARLVGPRERISRVLEAAEIAELPAATVELARIVAGVGRYGVDLGPRNFPQESRLDAALSFDKGCFVGQEIVARIRSRGAVKQFLVRLDIGGATAPDAPISSEGRKIGHVTSVTGRPDGRFVALGYVGADFGNPGTEVEVDGNPARVVG